MEKNGYQYDNRYVITYNRELLLRYRAHIHVEWGNQSGSVKYLFKYIIKVRDRVSIVIKPGVKGTTEDSEDPLHKIETNKRNEIKDFFYCTYDRHYRIP